MTKDQKKGKYRVAIILSHPIHYLTALCRELAARPDIELTVYFCSDFGLHPGYDATFGRTVTWYDERILEGFAYRFLPRWFSRGSSPGGFWSVTNPRIVTELIRGRYDAVAIHGYTYCTNWLAVIAAKLVGTAVFLRGESNLLERRSVSVSAVKWLVLRTLFPFIDRFLTIGTLNTRFYEHYGIRPERLFLTPYAVDNTLLQSEHRRLLPDRGVLRRALGVNDDSPVILFVSKLIARKRPMDLLIAYRALMQNSKERTANGGESHLVFVGDGPERETLERYTKGHGFANVRFLGFKRPSDIAPYFAAADIFAFPSGSETWGLVVNEAMNFGLPVITTNMVAASYDIVQNGETGFVCPVGDTTMFTQRLRTLVDSAELRQEQGRKALERISTWSNREAADGILRALRTL
jgi:glycosyltransferase involved in cell wall biosynthesis